MASKVIDESTRVWILQAAIMKVKSGKDPKVEMDADERASYDRTVKELEMYKELVGPKKFSETTFDVGYDV